MRIDDMPTRTNQVNALKKMSNMSLHSEDRRGGRLEEEDKRQGGWKGLSDEAVTKLRTAPHP